MDTENLNVMPPMLFLAGPPGAGKTALGRPVCAELDRAGQARRVRLDGMQRGSALDPDPRSFRLNDVASHAPMLSRTVPAARCWWRGVLLLAQWCATMGS